MSNALIEFADEVLSKLNDFQNNNLEGTVEYYDFLVKSLIKMNGFQLKPASNHFACKPCQPDISFQPVQLIRYCTPCKIEPTRFPEMFPLKKKWHEKIFIPNPSKKQKKKKFEDRRVKDLFKNNKFLKTPLPRYHNRVEKRFPTSS